FYNATSTSQFYTLSLHDALPILLFYTNGMAFFNKHHEVMPGTENFTGERAAALIKRFNYSLIDSLEHINIYNFYNTDIKIVQLRSEEHTSELQSRENLVCRLLLE